MFDPLIEWFFTVLYIFQACVCYLIDFIKNIFFKLCGLDTVKSNGKDVDLVTSIIMSDTVHRIFLTVFLIGVVLLVIFIIIALIRANYQTSERKGYGAILTKAGHGLLIFLLVPFLLLAGITLINTIMASINMSMQIHVINGQANIGGQMLTITGFDAYIGQANSRETIEQMFLSGELDYNNVDVVKQYYDLSKINYVIGLIGSLVILVMFVLSSLTFVQRIFDIALLYIISPVSISTLPIDDGNRFKIWRDMIISKVLSAYGIILVMNLFFLIIPQVTQITFFESDFENGIVFILFLIGGAFAVTKASLVISQLFGTQSGGREFAQMIYNIRSGVALARTATAATGAVLGRAIGGSDYLKNRQKGNSRFESLNMSMHSNRNQRVVNENANKNRAKQIAAMPVRLATMPVGVVKDLLQGGLITAGKNFVPRLKNVAVGDSIVNRADRKAKAIDLSPQREEFTTGKNTNDYGTATSSTRESGNLEGGTDHKTNTKEHKS